MRNKASELIKKFEIVLKDYKENPEKYKNGKQYRTENGGLINTIYEDEFSVFGVILESEINAEIGLTNIFLHCELKEKIN